MGQGDDDRLVIGGGVWAALCVPVTSAGGAPELSSGGEDLAWERLEESNGIIEPKESKGCS